MRRIASFGIAASLTACGGGLGGSTDVEATLVFADRTDIEISRLINAAAATDMFGAQSTAQQFDDFDPGPCPAQAITGDTVVLTGGGCVDEDGYTINGTISITNPLGWGDDAIEYNYNEPVFYEFTDFSMSNGLYTVGYTGFVEILEGFTGYDCDITVNQFDMVVRSDLHIECSQSGCDTGNSGIELVGVGGALVSGEVNIANNSATSDYTLEGADTLTFHQEPGCLRWQIEGTDRIFAPCPQ